MTQLANCYKNILELSTVTLATGTADSSYPLWRLYDRNVGRMFKTTAAVTTTIKVAQTSTIAIDRLLIPSGHNLSGMTLDIKWSDDDITYTAATPQWTGAAGLINKSWAPITHQYWKFIITSPASIPQIPELFLCPTYTWERNPTRPTGDMDDVFNVENLLSSGGQDRFLTYGTAKRSREYTMPSCSETQKVNILALNNAWAGGVPFWLCDHEGTWIYGKLTKKIAIKEIAYQRYSFEFGFLEVIA